MKDKFLNFIHSRPGMADMLFLLAFAVFITFQPYCLEGEINIYELGLYLPGINAILSGEIPYRDFFHLRGPFELYMPAFIMLLFGKQIWVITIYFYVGSVLTLLIGILIAKELFKTRYFYFLMTFVFVGKTFPRVVFKYWGGMRYVLGLLAVYYAIQFFKHKRTRWLFVAGCLSALGLLTSVEIGVSAIAAILASLLFSLFVSDYRRSFYFRAAVLYAAGIMVISVPYLAYLSEQGALLPYLESVTSVITNMQTVINHHVISQYPSNVWEFLVALVNPASANFQHMTPTYLYLSLGVYLTARLKLNRSGEVDQSLACLGVYGLLLYITSFRSIWGAQFEMALQPEKILYFFILEEIYLYSLKKKKDILALVKKDFPPRKPYLWQYTLLYTILLYFLWVSTNSIGYSMMRYTKRFYSFRYCLAMLQNKNIDHLRPLAGKSSREIDLQRGKGMVTTIGQAKDLEDVTRFIKYETHPSEMVLMYPERGIFNFLSDRRFLGRFPTATLSWFNDDWHREFVTDLKAVRPRFVIMPSDLQENKYKVYFSFKANKDKYDEVMGIIGKNYELEKTTQHSLIYRRNKRAWLN